MIDTSTSILTERREFEVARAQLQVDPPVDNPLIARDALTARGGKEWTFGLVAPQEPGAQADVKDLLASLSDRLRRDSEHFPQSARIHLNLGLALLNQGNVTEAERAIRRSLELDPENYAAKTSLARLLVREGKLQDAEGLFLSIRRETASDVPAAIGLAILRIRQGDAKGAGEILDQAIERNSSDAVARFFRGITHLLAGEMRKAIGQFRKATHLDVRSPAFHQALAVAYLAEGNFPHAALSFRTALALKPTLGPAVRGLAEILLREEKYHEAASLLNAYREKAPDDVRALETLAQAEFKLGHYLRAAGLLFDCLALLERKSGQPIQIGRVLNNIGACLAQSERSEEAEEWFRRAVATAPESAATPLLNLARVAIQKRRFSDALELLGEYSKRYPGGQDAALLTAACSIETGEYESAVAQLRDVTEAKEPSELAFALLGGLLTDEVRDLNQAIAVLEEGWKRNRGGGIVGNNLAYALLMKGDVARARDVLEGITGRERGVALEATRGLLSLREGDLAAGLRGYRRALLKARAKRDTALARRVKQKMHLEVAKAFWRQGQKARTLSEIERGLRVDGKAAYRRDLEELRASVSGDAPAPEE